MTALRRTLFALFALVLPGCGLFGGRVTLADCLAHRHASGLAPYGLDRHASGLAPYGLDRHASGLDTPVTLLPVCVDSSRGAMDIETEYLPGVLECEVGGFRKTPTALEAQAIVARTYLLAHFMRNGFDTPVGLTASFQCWKPPTNDAVRLAVRRTRDVVIHRHGDVLDANYASGTSKLTADCAPKGPAAAGYSDYATWDDMRDRYREARKKGHRHGFSGTGWTELLVTRNEGRDGLAVEPTAFAPVRPTNRGAFGQWAAACLAGKRAYTTPAILRYFFGDDVQFSSGLEAPAPASESGGGGGRPRSP